MKREQLEALELSKEAIDAIMKMHGEDINAQKDAHAKALETAQGETNTVKEQLVAANKQISEFEKMDVEGAKKAVQEWQAKAEQFQADLEEAQKTAAAEVTKIKRDHALEAALAEAKARDPKDILPHLDYEKLVFGDDGKIVGLEDQLKPLQETKGYLFDDGKPDRKIVTGGNNKSILSDSVVDAARQAAGLEVTKEK